MFGRKGKVEMMEFTGHTTPLKVGNISPPTDEALLQEIEREFNRLPPATQREVQAVFARENAKMKLRNIERLDKELAQVKAQEFNQELMTKAREQYELEKKHNIRFI